MKNNIHVIFKNKKWIIKEENNESTKSFKTKDKAIENAKELAKENKVELIIHNKNNIISNKNSFGNDTNPPKDTVL